MPLSKISALVSLAVLCCLASISHAAPAESRELRALREAGKRKLFETPVLVQQLYTPQLEESFVFQPVASTNTSGRAWELKVTFDNSPEDRMQVRFTNPGRVSSPTQANRLSIAVLAASKFLDNQGELSFPTRISAGYNYGQYGVAFNRLPLMPGGLRVVTISKDLKHYELAYGH